MRECPEFLETDPVQRLLAIRTAANHAARAHKGQFRKDRKTPYISHPAKVAGLVGQFGGTHTGIVAAWCHDILEDCGPVWIQGTATLVQDLPLPESDRTEISEIIDAMTKKNSIRDKSARLSDSLDRILDAPPEATLVKICDRIDNFLDSANRNGRYTRRYLASTDEVIEKLSTRASLYGYGSAMGILVTMRNGK